MSAWFSYVFIGVFVVLSSTALFFFALTRGTLIVRGAMGRSQDPAAHVYPLYSNMRLIKLIDFQPIIAAILLFQYDRLVSTITNGLHHTDLRGKKVLITSCAFGNVIPRVVTAAVKSGAQRVLIADIIKNELVHANSKMPEFAGKLEFLQENATAMKQPDESVDANVMFLLLHELPHELKGKALSEAMRVLTPGGKLYLAEFHRPELWVLRALSWTYFKVFEPLGLALWDSHDPVKQLEALGGVTCERRTVFFGNFQVVTATKNPRP
ncbi:MAG: class I SAM-dependent methyltransferase [Rhodoferax sp.]|uniref:class I SAM-dependent methyltransferase n=1 Tax=Rhodoferax sp. TaxID=50421 RepID=UPI0013FF8D6B|nr:class I SAM-dependent methyltransferase [Rhodoferax sp.]NDP39786.1 class I SAM-dependent methyltransferase [Rhodoferax sp.]